MHIIQHIYDLYIHYTHIIQYIYVHILYIQLWRESIEKTVCIYLYPMCLVYLYIYTLCVFHIYSYIYPMVSCIFIYIYLYILCVYVYTKYINLYFKHIVLSSNNFLFYIHIYTHLCTFVQKCVYTFVYNFVYTFICLNQLFQN